MKYIILRTSRGECPVLFPSEAELDEWADRVLECRGLKEVFGGSA